MELKSELKRPYEAIILVHPDTTLEEQKELFKKNKTTITSFNGAVHSLETWGKRTLATPIGKLKKAVYFHTVFEAGTQAVAELERTMRINDKVLRFMHTKLDERVSPAKHIEAFKKGLQDSAAREKEREAKSALRKQAAMQARSERYEKDDN
ncbi:MAG: 30S ribosomal protein S6 [Bdellovibrionales bacterium RIFCSPHIGHO2_01_FULL_40_29]|nr:MAG: 30S ribosomal protein S6 [Bdellovibrionales bacterium RIFCSPHIGHO2_01_FULL_40_29]OFZ34657.1 MAG: 30S ribosomal protein S6 [Bdellovibrionales bacterium RIFCSPHIGHO2_02_FULL_40_15]